MISIWGQTERTFSSQEMVEPDDRESCYSAMSNDRFIIEAFDRTLWCPIAQSAFEVSDLEVLRHILGEPAVDDLELSHEYTIEHASELAMIETTFGVGFSSEITSRPDIEITVCRLCSLSPSTPSMPYMSHIGYELPLMLDGRKKLAKMYHEYPPTKFDGEDSFDRWVEKGLLSKEVVLEPHQEPRGQFEGVRTAYYTVKGEEWRVPATKLIWRAAAQSGCWNEYFERLEGMLFGYEDWQNDWWIDNRRPLRKPIGR